MSFTSEYLKESIELIKRLNESEIENVVQELVDLRRREGRLFVLGVGGSAGHAAHAVNDFRKLCAIETYAPTDNVSELTARTNDEGWDTSFSEWLKVSKLSSRDAVLVFSVGGGNLERKVSMNIVHALNLAVETKAAILGIVGRDGGETKKLARACVVVPTISPERVTPHTEGLCAVIWHLIVSHPNLGVNKTKW